MNKTLLSDYRRAKLAKFEKTQTIIAVAVGDSFSITEAELVGGETNIMRAIEQKALIAD